MLAACSRQAMRFCYRCHLLECRLGSHCSAAQHCRNSPVSHCHSKWGRQEKPADPNQPRRKATQRALKKWDEDLRSQRLCPNCGKDLPRSMPNCGFCKTALGDRQELLLDIAQVEPQK